MALDGRNAFSYKLDASDIRMIEYNANNKGKINYMQELLAEIDLPNYRYLQTIHFRYKYNMAALVYLGYDKKLLQKVHEANLEYEVTNPPIIYDKTKSKPVKLKRTKGEGKRACATPVRKGDSDIVRLIKIEDNTALNVSRETAVALFNQFNGKYRIEEL
jgi:hypothetical protein